MTKTLLFALLLSSQISLANDIKLEKCPVLKVAGGDWLKYEYIERYKGSATGKGIELLKKFDENFAVQVLIMPGTPYPRQLKELKEGKLDFMIGLFNIEKRRKEYQLSAPYFVEPLHVYALKDTFQDTVSLNNLTDLIAGLRRGSSYGDELDFYFSHNKQSSAEVKDSENVAKLLLKKRIDYFIATPTVKQEFLVISDDIKQYNSIASQETSFAFSKKSPCIVWLDELNQLIAEAQHESIKPLNN